MLGLILLTTQADAHLYGSGEVLRQRPIIHQGPVWLRWALVTAANAATHSRSPLGRRYARRRQGKHPNVAKMPLRNRKPQWRRKEPPEQAVPAQAHGELRPRAT
jgi:hypothetical protein